MDQREMSYRYHTDKFKKWIRKMNAIMGVNKLAIVTRKIKIECMTFPSAK
jgi:hypothetical protein